MSSRIPATLQAVFLSSNRGKEVHEPPPESAANRTYLPNWRFHQNIVENSIRSLFGQSQEKIKHLVIRCGNKSNKPEVLVASAAAPASTPRNVGEKTKLPPYFSSSLPAVLCPPPDTDFKNESPQEFLDTMLRGRGYSTDTYKTLQTAYFNQPTTYQQACYGAKVADVIRQGDVKTLRAMMLGGMSPNPCNVYGESLVHMTCRRGNDDLLRVLIAAGVSLQVSDDYGRTPLHDACWSSTPAFAVVDLILKADNRLFYMMDHRGSLPLSYVHKDHWSAWIKYLEEKKDEHFPILTATQQGPPELTKYGPNSRPIPNPEHALPENLAAMVATGRLSIIEANMMASEDDEDEDDASVDSTVESDDEDDEDDESCDDDDDDDGDDESSDYDSGSDCDSDDDDDDELFDILQITQARFVA